MGKKHPAIGRHLTFPGITQNALPTQKQKHTCMKNTYLHPRLGVGEIIGHLPDGEIVVRFDSPPGMLHGQKAHVVPVITLSAKVEEICRPEPLPSLAIPQLF